MDSREQHQLTQNLKKKHKQQNPLKPPHEPNNKPLFGCSAHLQHKDPAPPSPCAPRVPWEHPGTPVPSLAPQANPHMPAGGGGAAGAAAVPAPAAAESSATEIIPSRLDFVQGARSRGFFFSVETGLEKGRIGIFPSSLQGQAWPILLYCKYKSGFLNIKKKYKKNEASLNKNPLEDTVKNAARGQAEISVAGAECSEIFVFAA